MIIYKITNKITGKCYIGQTTRTLEKRWKYVTAYAGGDADRRLLIQYSVGSQGTLYFPLLCGYVSDGSHRILSDDPETQKCFG